MILRKAYITLETTTIKITNKKIKPNLFISQNLYTGNKFEDK